MFDSLAIARRLTDAGIERTHADAIADGISRAAEPGDHVTPDAFAAGLAALRGERQGRRLAMRRCGTRRVLAGVLAFGLATLGGAGSAAA